MNNFVVGGISFVIGGLVGFFISKKIIADKLENEFIDRVDEEVALQMKIEREFLERRLNEIENAEKTILPKNPIPVRNEYQTTKTVYNQKGDLNTIVKEKNYTPEDEEYWYGDGEEDEDDVLRDPSGMSEEDYLNPDCSTTHDMDGIDRSLPYVITEEEYYKEFDHHEKNSLTLYTVDEVLVEDMTDEIIEIEDFDESVGWDFLPILEDGAGLVYVRNERISMDFEITTMHSSYANSKFGIRGGLGEAKNPREAYESRKKQREEDE